MHELAGRHLVRVWVRGGHLRELSAHPEGHETPVGSRLGLPLPLADTLNFPVFLELWTVTARKTDPVLLNRLLQTLLVEWAVKVAVGIDVAVS